MRKIYNYPGITTGVICIPAGKATLRVIFAKGYLDKKMARPATFSTEDPITQEIIERSPLFGTRIFLGRCFGAPQEDPGEMDVPVREPVEYPEVTSWEEAIQVLKGIPEVKATQLRTPASARRVAAINGIVFPNYNFE